MGIKLWLDDCRQAPPNYEWVMNYDEAVKRLEEIKRDKLEFDVFQMDHDLEDAHYMSLNGDHEKTGYSVMCWMEEHDVFPKIVIIHSFNPFGAKKMLDVAVKHTQAVYRKYSPETQWE